MSTIFYIIDEQDPLSFKANLNNFEKTDEVKIK